MSCILAPLSRHTPHRTTSSSIVALQVHYFLSDDTIEVRSVHGPNSGRDPVPVMVKRGRIPKSITGGASSEAYHWSDFDIGVEVST